MNVGKVVGTVVATRKDPKLEGVRLLVVEQTNLEGETSASSSRIVAVDSVGAGVGEVVLYAQGSSARQTDATQNRPVDAVIMGIIDEIEKDGSPTFQKS